MKKLTLLVVAPLLFLLASCGAKFTDVKIRTADGKEYQAHVIQNHVSVPDTGDVIPIIRTGATNGYIYNSRTWTLQDASDYWFNSREVITGTVIAILPPKEN
jgi:hypothetical protein